MTKHSDDEIGVQATAALHASDIAHNTSAANSTMSLVALTVAYLSITTLALEDLDAVPTGVFAWIALPVVFLQSYQMLLAAAVMRRAALARYLEAVLVRAAHLPKTATAAKVDSSDANHIGIEWPRFGVGTDSSDSVMDFDRVSGWREKALASMAYFGFYLIGIAYTLYVVLNTFWRYYGNGQGTGFPAWLVVSVVAYVILWYFFTASAIRLFLRSDRDRPVVV